MSPRRLLPVPSGPGEPFEGYGTIVSVEILQAGTELVGDHTSGVSMLQVLDVSGIPGEGVVLVAGDELPYTATDDLTDPDTTAANETITLAAATTSSYPARALVTLLPVREYKEALVVLDAAPDKAVTCLVDHKLEDNLEEGPRADGTREIVWVRQRRGELTLTVETIKGRRKKVDGGYLDGTKPMTPGALVETFAQHEAELASRAPLSMLASGPLPSDVQMAGLFAAGGMTADLQGFHVTRDDGSAAFDAPVDGRPVRISGEIDATKTVTTDGARLGGPSKIPAGSSLKLSATLDPPWLPPSVLTSWPKTDVPFTGRPQDRVGYGVETLASGSEVAYTAQIDPMTGEATLVTFNPVSDDVVSELPMTGAPKPGVMASLTYSLFLDRVVSLEWVPTQSRWKVRYWHKTTGNFDFQWEWTEGGAVQSPRPSMGIQETFGGEHVAIARSNPDGTVDINRYTDEVLTVTTTTTDALNLGDLAGCARLGATIILTSATNQVFPAGIPGPTGQEGKYPNRPVMPVINLGFVGAPGDLLGWLCVGDGNTAACGVTCWDGDSELRTFYLSSVNNMAIQHSNVFESGDYWAQASWVDTLVAGIETLPSPAVRIFKLPGSQITFSVANPPPGWTATSVGAAFYLGQGASFPGNSSMFFQVANTQTDGVITATVFSVAGSGDNPPTVPTFTDGGDPAPLLSDDDSVIIDASYSHAHDLGYRVLALESGGGGGGTGGIDIDCGNASATGVEIDCGAA